MRHLPWYLISDERAVRDVREWLKPNDRVQVTKGRYARMFGTVQELVTQGAPGGAPCYHVLLDEEGATRQIQWDHLARTTL